MSKEDTQFKKGNPIGTETRFQPGNKLRTKYKESYAEDLLTWFRECERFPTIEGWAVENDIAFRTVQEWMANPDKYPRFAYACQQAKAMQKDKLVDNGLADKYNSSLVKFLLMNNHGMSDKSSNDTNITFNVEYTSSEIDEESN
jgi:hypothetical protein